MLLKLISIAATAMLPALTDVAIDGLVVVEHLTGAY